MTRAAFLDGLRRVVAAPAVLAGVFVMTLVAALPLALTMRGGLQGHLGRSLSANDAADAVNYDWWQEFTAQAAGLGTSSLGTAFTPSIIGFATTLDSLSGVADARPPITPVMAAIAVSLLGWLFLSGGILDRYARQRPTRAHGFFSACGGYFFRFVRLGLVSGAVYWWLFAYVHGWLFDEWYADVTRDLAVERTAILWRAGMYAIFAALLAAVTLVFDYAKIRAVVEDRRSMLGALLASIGFIRRHPGRALGLYAANTALFLVIVGIWAFVAPGAGGAGASMWLGFLAGQIYVLARLVVKLQFMASQTALFQRSLAHATYVAAPASVWPESPAAETIGT